MAVIGFGLAIPPKDSNIWADSLFVPHVLLPITNDHLKDAVPKMTGEGAEELRNRLGAWGRTEYHDPGRIAACIPSLSRAWRRFVNKLLDVPKPFARMETGAWNISQQMVSNTSANSPAIPFRLDSLVESHPDAYIGRLFAGNAGMGGSLPAFGYHERDMETLAFPSENNAFRNMEEGRYGQVFRGRRGARRLVSMIRTISHPVTYHRPLLTLFNPMIGSNGTGRSLIEFRRLAVPTAEYWGQIADWQRTYQSLPVVPQLNDDSVVDLLSIWRRTPLHHKDFTTFHAYDEYSTRRARYVVVVSEDEFYDLTNFGANLARSVTQRSAGIYRLNEFDFYQFLGTYVPPYYTEDALIFRDEREMDSVKPPIHFMGLPIYDSASNFTKFGELLASEINLVSYLIGGIGTTTIKVNARSEGGTSGYRYSLIDGAIHVLAASHPEGSLPNAVRMAREVLYPCLELGVRIARDVMNEGAELQHLRGVNVPALSAALRRANSLLSIKDEVLAISPPIQAHDPIKIVSRDELAVEGWKIINLEHDITDSLKRFFPNTWHRGRALFKAVKVKWNELSPEYWVGVLLQPKDRIAPNSGNLTSCAGFSARYILMPTPHLKDVRLAGRATPHMSTEGVPCFGDIDPERVILDSDNPSSRKRMLSTLQVFEAMATTYSPESGPYVDLGDHISYLKRALSEYGVTSDDGDGGDEDN